MKNKKTIILSAVASLALLALIIGATYAYFQAGGGTNTNTDVKVTTYTTDALSFEVGSDISLYADQTTFASGKGNATGSTFAKAILTANNKTNTSTMNYYLYLRISKNSFGYTQNTSTPELLLTITDASGNAVTDITSLTYKTVTDGKGASISGYDITNKSGLIILFDKKAITASPTKTDEWNITVTFINYNADQSNNMGKEFNAKLMIQKEEYELTLADICTDKTLKECVISQYTGTQGGNNIYYHTSTLTNGAGDKSYRYAGPSDSVNNFVCFGSDAATCPTDNLYRIIGVIDDKVKLIKYDYATSDLLGTDGDYCGSSTPSSSTYKGSLSSVNTYYWNYKASGSVSNTWSTSLLNKTNLNTNFINSIGSTWAGKIATTAWKVGGGTNANIKDAVPATAYQYEVGANASTTTYEAKIGLMYVSDYGFAASPSAWTITMYNYNDSTATSNNWMYMGYYDWTISRSSDTSLNAFYVPNTGPVYNNNANGRNGVRPSFNLESTVAYVSGSGSMSDPIRVN